MKMSIVFSMVLLVTNPVLAVKPPIRPPSTSKRSHPLVPSGGRPLESFETIVERMPIIFDGTVVEVTEVDTPSKESYFTNETKAMKVRFATVKIWKGTSEKEITAYTWPRGKAPCANGDFKVGASYLVYAEWDRTKKFKMFDSCRHLQSNESKGTKAIHHRLQRALGK